MKKILVISVAIGFLLGAGVAKAGDYDADNNRPANPLTLAVFGDWPYSTSLLAAAPLLIASINSDPNVSLVMHVGDIHSGSMPCTGAGLNPIPVGANPGWNASIFNLFQQFEDPFVYTPGDNEWTDCHKKKELQSGAPMNELAAVRSLFFPNPGVTLGLHPRLVLSQAQIFNPFHPTDQKFVENVMWIDAGVVFVMLHLPGSNNDGIMWTAPFTDETARTTEVAERSGADKRWMELAFAIARVSRAKAIVIGTQADMWDPAALVPGGDGLSEYTAFVREMADLSVAFGRPVLLINGDSHLYGVDHPLADPSSATGIIHGTQAVPNLTRITVQGSTNHPSEWLRLTIDPRSPEVFTWENVVYLP